MNKIYRVIFNHATQTWTAVSELAKGRTKTKSEKVATLAVAVSLALGATGAYAATVVQDGIATRTDDNKGRVILTDTHAGGDQSVQVGSRINMNDSNQSIAIGNDISINGRGAIAIGGDDANSAGRLGVVAGQNFLTVARESGGFTNAGYRTAQVTGNGTIGIGTFVVANGTGATAVGLGATASVEGATSFGTLAFSTGTGSSAFGLASRAEGSNTLALGAGARANLSGSVALGAGSVVTEGVAVTSAGQKYDIGGTTYDPLTNTNYDVSNVVSVGNATVKRQIQNVAPGQITETSTDAINGSQLYAITKGVQQIINNNYQTIQNNINNSGFHLKNNAGATVADVNKDDSLTFKNGTFTTATVNANREVAYNVVTQNINVANGVPTETGTAGLATAQTVATAIKNSGFNLQANGQNGSLIKAGDTVSINKGDNTEVIKSGNTITVHANKAEVTATASDIKLDTKVTGRTTAYNISLSDAVKEDIAKGVQALSAVEGRVFSFDGDNSTTTGEVSEGNITFAGGDNINTVASEENGRPTVTINLDSDITVDNVTVGTVKIIKDEGINAGDKTITGVANAVNANDAVNLSQLNATKVSVVGGANITSIDTKVTDNGTTYTINAKDTSASVSNATGSPVSVTKGTEKDGVTDYVVDLTTEAKTSLEKANTAVQSVTGKDGITAEKQGDTVTVGLTLESKASLQKADSAIQEIKTTVNGQAVKTLNQADNTQDFKNGKNIDITTEDGKIIVATKPNVEFTSVSTNTLDAKIGKITDLTSVKMTTGSITATTAAVDNLTADNANVGILLTRDSATIGGLLTANGGLAVASNQRIDMGDNQVHNVKAGTADTDAVNVSQLKANTTTVAAGKNITSVNEVRDANGIRYTIDGKDTTVSNAQGSPVSVTKGTEKDGVTDYVVDLTAEAKTSLEKANTAVQNVTGKDGITAEKQGDTVTVGLTPESQASLQKADSAIQEIKTTVNGQAVKTLTKDNNTQDFVNGDNIEITNDNGAIKVATKQNVSFTDVKTGTLSTTGTATIGGMLNANGGLTVANGQTVQMGNNRIQGVANAVESTDAVNLSQLNATKVSVVGGANITSVDSKVTDNGTIYTINAKDTSATVSSANDKALKVTQGAETNGITDFALELGDDTKASLAKADTAVQDVKGQGGITATKGADNVVTVDLDEATKANLTKADSAIQEIKTTVNGQAVKTLTKDDNTQDFENGKNIDIATKDGKIIVATKDSVTFTDVRTDTLSTTGTATIGGMLNANGGLTVANGQTVNMGDNRIQGVADGTNDKDAVNLSQLNATKNAINTEIAKGLNFSADSGNVVNRQLGDTLAIVGGNGQGEYSTTNVRTVTTADGVRIELADNPTFNNVKASDVQTATLTTTGTATIGGMLNANGGLTVANGQTVQMGDNRVQGVADGTADTDAVNVSQLRNNVTTLNNNIDAAKTELTAKGLDFSGNTGETHRDLGTKLAITGEATTQGNYSGANLKTVVTATGVALQFADNPEFKDITATSIKTGDNVLNGTGLTIGTASITNADGINAGNKTIKGVANATKDDEAVNLAQLKAQSVTVKAGQNVNSVNEVKTDDGITYTIDAKDTTVSKGSDAVTVEKGTETNGVTDYKVDLSTDTKASLAKADTAVQNVTGKDGITAEKQGDTVTVGLDEATKANLTKADTAVQEIKTTVNGQAVKTLTKDNNTQDFENGKNIDITTKDGKIIVATKDSVTFTDVNTDTLTANTGTIGTLTSTTINNAGAINTQTLATTGTATIGGMLNANGGLTVANGQTIQMGNNRVQGVANAVESTDAVNLSQLNATKVSVVGGANITSVDSKVTADGTTYTINAKDTSATVSSANEKALKVTQGTQTNGITDFALELGDDTKASLAKADTAVQDVKGQGGITATKGTDNVVTVDLDDATKANLTKADSAIQEIKTTVNGQAVKTLTKDDNTQDFENGKNIDIATKDGKIIVATKDSVTFTDVKTDTLSTTGDATIGGMLNAGGGLTVASGQTVQMGNNRVQGVADGTADTDAVNVSQLRNNVTTLNNNIDAAKTELTAKGLDFSGNTGETHRDLGTKLAITGEATTQGNYSGANLKTVVTATGVALQFADNPEFKDITATSIKTGDNVLNGTGLTIGTASITNADGINAGNKTIKGVANATANDEAVNLAQLKAQSVTVKAGQNVNSVNEVKTDDGITYTIDAKDTTVSKGSDAVTVEKGAETNGVTDYKVDLSADTKASLAKADTAVQEIETQIDGKTVKTVKKDDNTANFITGDNIELTDENGAIKVATKKDVTFDKVNSTVIEAVDARINNVQADDIVTLDLTSTHANINTLESHQIRAGDIKASTGTITDLTSNHITANSIDARSIDVISLTAKDTKTDTLATTGNAQIGGKLTVQNGIDATNNRIENVANATRNSDAVNLAQLKANTTTVVAGANITSVDKVADENGVTYTINAKDTSATVSSANEKALKVTQGTPNNGITDFALELGDDTKASLAKADSSVQSIVNKVNGQAVNTLTKNANEQDFINGDNIEITNDNGAIKVATKQNVSFTDVKTGTLSTTGTAAIGGMLNANGGLTVANGQTVQMGNNRVQGVADGTADKDAVNVSQLRNNVTTLNNNIDAAKTELTAKGLDFSGNTGETHRDLGTKLAITGEATTQGNYSGANLKTVVTETGVALQFADNPEFKDIKADSIKTGDNVLNGTGLTIGTASITNADGINAGNKTIKGVANATANDEAVNLAQLKAQSVTVKAGQNVNSVNEVKTDDGITYTIDAKDTTVSKGSDAVTVEKGTETNGVTDYKVDLSAESKASLAKADTAVQNVQGQGGITATKGADNVVTVDLDEATKANLTKADSAIQEIKTTVNGQAVKTLTKDNNTQDFVNGDNIEISNDNGAIKVATAKTVAFDKVTVGTASIDKDAGINAGNKTIQGVADATKDDEAVNLSQLNATKNTINTEIAKGLNFSADSGNVVNRQLGDTLAIVGGNGQGDYSTTNVRTVTTTDGVRIELADNPTFKNVKANDVQTAMLTTTGTATIGGMLNAGGGLTVANGQTVQMGNNRVQGVANAVESTDAVNLSQLNATKVSVVGGANITSIDTKVTDNGTTYTINAKDTSATVSSANEKALKVTQGAENNGITDFALELGDDTKASLAKADTAVQNVQGQGGITATKGADNVVTVDLDEATKQSLAKADTAVQEIETQIDGKTVKTVKKDDNTANFITGDNIELTDENGAIKVATKKDVTFTNVNTDTLTATTGTIGTLTSTTINNAGAINTQTLATTGTATIGGMLNANGGLTVTNGQTVNMGNNTISNVASGGDVGTNAANIDDVKRLAKSADTTASTSGTNGIEVLKVEQNGQVTDYQVGLTQATRDDIAKGVQASDDVANKGLTFTGDTGTTTAKKLGGSLAITGDDNISTTATANGMAISLNRNLTADSLSIGNVVINNAGINAGNQVISNVANGVADNDAVNVAQLKANSVKVVAGANITSVESQVTPNGTTYTINAKDTSASVSAASNALTVKAGEQNNGVIDYAIDLSDEIKASLNKANTGVQTVNGKDGITAEKQGDTVTVGLDDTTKASLAKADTAVQVVNGKNGITATKTDNGYDVELDENTKDSLAKADTAVQNITTKVNGKEVKTLNQADNSQDFVDGDNITISNDNGAIKVATKQNVSFTDVKTGTLTATGDTTVGGTLTANGGLTVANGQTVNMGNNRIQGVANGVADTDAVNVAQLNNATKALNDNINTAVNNAGWTVKANGDNGQKVANNDEVNFVQGDNIIIERSGTDITVKTTDNPNFKQVTAQSVQATTVNATTVNTDAVNAKSVQADTVKTTGDVTVGGTLTANGGLTVAAGQPINMGGNVVNGVAPAEISPSSTQAVNGAQIYELQQGINRANAQLNDRITGVEESAYGGTASAIATGLLPQAFNPGESLGGVAVGTYKGASAVAVGFSSISDNGKYIFKLAGGATNTGDYSGGAAFGIKFR